MIKIKESLSLYLREVLQDGTYLTLFERSMVRIISMNTVVVDKVVIYMARHAICLSIIPILGKEMGVIKLIPLHH